MARAAFPLMRHFLLWSVLTTALVAILLSFASAGEAEQDLLAKDRRYAKLLAAVIRAQLDEHFTRWLVAENREFRPGDDEQRSRIAQIIDYNTTGVGVIRVNLFDRRGCVVYSGDPARIGADHSRSPSLRRALDGTAVTRLVTPGEESHEFRNGAPPFLESYLPFRITLGSVEIGAIEIYQRGEDNLAAVEASKRRLAIAVIGAMLFLFIGNAVIVRRGSRAIEEERATSARYLTEARDLNEKLAALTEDLEQRIARAARELVAADRLAAVGTLAAGMAHEVNTPLASISTCAEGLLRRGESLGERERKYLETIRDEAFRCKRITRNLLEFARAGESEDAVEVELRELCARTIRLLDFEIGAKDVRVRLDGDPLVVRGSADELEQVVLNLVNNALQAVPRGGLITLAIRAVAGGRAQLVVEDDGPGAPEESLDRLLDPFYTTKEPGVGTGLGLSVSYGIVKRHGGEMRLENRAEGGFRALVTLPRASFVSGDPGDHS